MIAEKNKEGKFEKMFSALQNTSLWHQAEAEMASQEQQARQAMASELKALQAEKRKQINSLNAELTLVSKQADESYALSKKLSKRISQIQDQLFSVPAGIQREIDILKGKLYDAARPELLNRLEKIKEEIGIAENTSLVTGGDSMFGRDTYSNLPEINAKIKKLKAEAEDIKRQIWDCQ